MKISDENFRAIYFPSSGEAKILTFIANDGYVFHRDGEENYTTAFSVNAAEAEETLAQYECITKTDEMEVL